ncbi:MAG: hypothetical protein WC328_01510 [Kiritimatiellia bacterium]|jgi:hypothetical protein|nr:hypothetical protein [Kiritimatiellia bacterium]
MVAFLPAYDARGRAQGLLLNGFVELVADFAEQVLGDADGFLAFRPLGVVEVGEGVDPVELAHEGFPCGVETGVTFEVFEVGAVVHGGVPFEVIIAATE